MVIACYAPSFGGIFALLNATAIGDITSQSGYFQNQEERKLGA